MWTESSDPAQYPVLGTVKNMSRVFCQTDYNCKCVIRFYSKRKHFMYCITVSLRGTLLHWTVVWKGGWQRLTTMILWRPDNKINNKPAVSQSRGKCLSWINKAFFCKKNTNAVSRQWWNNSTATATKVNRVFQYHCIHLFIISLDFRVLYIGTETPQTETQTVNKHRNNCSSTMN